jgi:hypothetical protein
VKRALGTDTLVSALGTDLTGSNLCHGQPSNQQKRFQGSGHRFASIPSQPSQGGTANRGQFGCVSHGITSFLLRLVGLGQRCPKSGNSSLRPPISPRSISLVILPPWTIRAIKTMDFEKGLFSGWIEGFSCDRRDVFHYLWCGVVSRDTAPYNSWKAVCLLAGHSPPRYKNSRRQTFGQR